MSSTVVRKASHASSWYSADGERLSLELDRWLDAVPETGPCIGAVSSGGPPAEFPTESARIIIAPHAGYSYSGRASAWAYKALDLSKAKRIFVLGPSHHFYLSRCALSKCAAYDTPLGALPLDTETIADLMKTGMFDELSKNADEDEHSLEMQLPYIHKIASRTLSDHAALPPLVPILVGNTDAALEKRYGSLLAPYLSDPSNAFVISSDFAHWGSRFRYTYYEPANGSAVNLKSGQAAPTRPQIYESIAKVDLECVAAVESGDHDAFLQVLEKTGNTVCGRHPIGIAMAALEVVRQNGGRDGRFKFVRYERSSDCVSLSDSSVSYCSGFAVV